MKWVRTSSTPATKGPDPTAGPAFDAFDCKSERTGKNCSLWRFSCCILLDIEKTSELRWSWYSHHVNHISMLSVGPVAQRARTRLKKKLKGSGQLWICMVQSAVLTLREGWSIWCDAPAMPICNCLWQNALAQPRAKHQEWCCGAPAFAWVYGSRLLNEL